MSKNYNPATPFFHPSLHSGGVPIPRIVCLGGGNAMPKAVLTGLRECPVKLSVICAMLDSGGSAGRLRKDYKIVSPGDIRRAFIALANTSPVIQELFNYRFQTGELKGHNFANLLITALELATNNYERTIKEISKFLNVKHEVIPSTLDNANLYGLLENGKIISGETNIDIPKHNGNLKIKKVFLRPKVKAYPPAIAAIKKADLIVIGPGDLYSSLAQILLTQGIPEAIRKSKAKKVYICNLMTKYGETNNFTVLDFVKEIERYLGSEADYVIYNNFIPKKIRIKKYQKEHPELLEMVKINENLSSKKFIGKNLLLKKGPIEHDPNKIAKVILNLCRQ
ncbi:MAG: uridine diphosphate-N-acetylglucosamine-binding protein YvcK [Patescibacteria group bacterium]|nr:uridine diphosphate-N-acetylglucosamine-binding protein YvcK [Patescibacteria group bacterium]